MMLTETRNIKYHDITIKIKYGNKKNNKKTNTEYFCDYGIIKGLKDKNNKEIECYVNNNPDKKAKIYVIHQKKKEGKWDKDIVMIGFKSQSDARKMWAKHLDQSSKHWGGISTFNYDDFENVVKRIKKDHDILADKITHKLLKENKLIELNETRPRLFEEIVKEKKIFDYKATVLFECGDIINNKECTVDCFEINNIKVIIKELHEPVYQHDDVIFIGFNKKDAQLQAHYNFDIESNLHQITLEKTLNLLGENIMSGTYNIKTTYDDKIEQAKDLMRTYLRTNTLAIATINDLKSNTLDPYDKRGYIEDLLSDLRGTIFNAFDYEIDDHDVHEMALEILKEFIPLEEVDSETVISDFKRLAGI